MMSTKPRIRDITWAGSAYSIEVKYTEIIILKPAKGQAVKYIFNPLTAIFRNTSLPSLLKMPAITDAPENTPA